jgi:hypothetical protein
VDFLVALNANRDLADEAGLRAEDVIEQNFFTEEGHADFIRQRLRVRAITVQKGGLRRFSSSSQCDVGMDMGRVT